MKKLFITIFIVAISRVVMAGPATFSYDGLLTDVSGNAVELPSVVFTIRITSPNASQCVLWEEQQTLNMTGSGGRFTLWLGQGTQTANSPGLTFPAALSNSKTLTGLTCVAGTSYTPGPTDSRTVTLSFNDGTTTTVMSPSISIGSSPYAMEADTLQGKVPANFVQINSTTAAVTQTNLEQVFASAANVNQLMSLISGTNTSGGTTSFSGPVVFTADPTSSAAPTSSTSLVNKAYSDSSIAGKAVDGTLANLSSGDTGKVLTWNGNDWVATSAASSGVQSLNGLTTPTQTFAIGSSGITPMFSSSGGTHTLNIPLASASSAVTAGLVSNADYGSWVRAGGTVPFTANQSMGGNKLTSLLDPASPQDAATKNYVDTHVTGGTVTNVGLVLPSIFSLTGSPITSSGTMVATLASQPQGTVLAAPTAGSGTPSFRSLASTDLPTVLVAQGGTGASVLAPNGVLMANATGTSVTSTLCPAGQAFVSSGTAWNCTPVPPAGTAVVNGGNSYGNIMGIGTIDNNSLNLLTGGSTRLTVSQTGSVGIGITAPSSFLETVDAGVKTAAYTSVLHAATNTSTTAAVSKVGMDIESTGTWTGTSATNTGLIVNVSGATTNYAAAFMGGNVGVGTATPVAILDVHGHVANSGTSATVSSCGTSPSINGNDTRGTVVLGSGSPTSCTILFSTPYTTPPICVITPVNGSPGATAQAYVVPSVTSLVINFSASPTALQQYAYHCMQ